MSDSIQEQIMKKIALAFTQITAAAGYDNTIVSVQRHNLSGVDLADTPTILIKEGDCVPEVQKAAYPYARKRMQVFAVVATTQDEENDSRSGGELLNSLAADVEKRIGASQNWDGLAILTDPPSYLDVEVDAMTPILSRGVQFEVVFEHLRTNPYSQ